MRKWATWLLLAVFSCPAMASKSLSIEEFEQFLAKLQNKSDARVAQELADVELTEHVSLERLANWEKNYPGAQSHEALIRLADSAAFLKPPASDLPRISPPDSDTQERMLALASEYVKSTVARLPDFSALRETTHFEDTPSQETLMPMASSASKWHTHPLGIPIGRNEEKPLRCTGTSSMTVTYRGGKELVDTTMTKREKEDQPQADMTTSGEFGPILSVVIGDAMRGQVAWSHWEQSSGDPMAVMQYAVPQDDSNFAVAIPNGAKTDLIYPAYHGEIAIDPATGSILHLSVVGDMTGLYQSMQANMLVEYAPVAIGARTCMCPVHGVALSRVPVPGAAPDERSGTISMRTQLNDVEFTHYHQFGSEARILANDVGQAPSGGSAGAIPDGAPTPSASQPPATSPAPDHPR